MEERRMYKWKDLPLIIAQTDIFKYSAAMDTGYTQPNDK